MSAKLFRFGRDLQSRVKGFFDNPPGTDATPLELLHATLDELERKVQPSGRGRRVFPYDRVNVRIAQAGVDAAAVEAVFGQLEQRLRDRLQELKCDAPDSMRTSINVFAPADGEEHALLTVDCFNEPIEPPVARGKAPSTLLRITVLKGTCLEPEYALDEPIIRIGRLEEPVDAFGQIRVNHIAFLDVRDGVNETVGRAHARLQIDAASGHYHLFNEGSSNPTSIVRAGRTIRVAPRDPRGVRIQSGDQVQLGRAVLKITID